MHAVLSDWFFHLVLSSSWPYPPDLLGVEMKRVSDPRGRSLTSSHSSLQKTLKRKKGEPVKVSVEQKNKMHTFNFPYVNSRVALVCW